MLSAVRASRQHSDEGVRRLQVHKTNGVGGGHEHTDAQVCSEQDAIRQLLLNCMSKRALKGEDWVLQARRMHIGTWYSEDSSDTAEDSNQQLSSLAEQVSSEAMSHAAPYTGFMRYLSRLACVDRSLF